MKKLHLIAILVIALISGNCAIGPVHGLLFTNTKFAGEFNPSNDVKVNKSAEGCLNFLLGISWGNASAGSIAYKNSIIKVATVDHSTVSVLGVYRNFCTIVSGEGK